MLQNLSNFYGIRWFDFYSALVSNPSHPWSWLADRPAMTTGRPKANPGWLFKKTAIWRCEIVMESDIGSYLKVSRGYKILSMHIWSESNLVSFEIPEVLNTFLGNS